MSKNLILCNTSGEVWLQCGQILRMSVRITGPSDSLVKPADYPKLFDELLKGMASKYTSQYIQPLAPLEGQVQLEPQPQFPDCQLPYGFKIQVELITCTRCTNTEGEEEADWLAFAVVNIQTQSIMELMLCLENYYL